MRVSWLAAALAASGLMATASPPTAAAPLATTTSGGLTLTVTRLTETPWDTVLDLTVTNASGQPMDVYDAGNARLTQGTATLPMMAYDPGVPVTFFPETGIAAGAAASDQLAFAPANPTGGPLTLTLPYASADFATNGTLTVQIPTGPTPTYPTPVPTVTAVNQSGTVVQLPDGPSPDATTVGIAQAAFPLGVPSRTAVLASGDPAHLIDALTAGPLAYHLQAPLLLTASSTSVGADLLAYLQANAIHTVYLIGVLGGADQAALAPALQAALPGVQLVAVTGADRFQTADAIAQQLPPAATVFVASGANGHLVDAVAATPAAALAGAPMLLESPTEGVPTNLLAAAHTVYVIGAAAGDAYAAVNAALPNATAVAGTDRNQTAALIAQQFFPQAARAIVAPGADADLQWTLAAGPLAAQLDAPILLAEPGQAAETVALLHGGSLLIRQLLVGGAVTTDPLTVNQLEGAL
ncbi:MAG: cell wall-binding repeat-containing protein [Firmicutes bacterium]|nr:cell wall-binding repeat-containing protein [Bacillota bacterium]